MNYSALRRRAKKQSENAKNQAKMITPIGTDNGEPTTVNREPQIVQPIEQRQQVEKQSQPTTQHAVASTRGPVNEWKIPNVNIDINNEYVNRPPTPIPAMGEVFKPQAVKNASKNDNVNEIAERTKGVTFTDTVYVQNIPANEEAPPQEIGENFNVSLMVKNYTDQNIPDTETTINDEDLLMAVDRFNIGCNEEQSVRRVPTQHVINARDNYPGDYNGGDFLETTRCFSINQNNGHMVKNASTLSRRMADDDVELMAIDTTVNPFANVTRPSTAPPVKNEFTINVGSDCEYDTGPQVYDVEPNSEDGALPAMVKTSIFPQPDPVLDNTIAAVSTGNITDKMVQDEKAKMTFAKIDSSKMGPKIRGAMRSLVGYGYCEENCPSIDIIKNNLDQQSGETLVNLFHVLASACFASLQQGEQQPKQQQKQQQKQQPISQDTKPANKRSRSRGESTYIATPSVRAFQTGIHPRSQR